MHVFLEKTRLQWLVRIAAKPGLREIVTKITITVRRPRLVHPEEFLRSAWSEHEMRRLLTTSASTKIQGLHGDMPVRRRTKPESVDFHNFHSSIGQAESSCYYCRNLSLEGQFDRCTRRLKAWKTWHDNKQDVALLKVAFVLLPNLKTVRIDEDVENERIWNAMDPPFFSTERDGDFAYKFSGSTFLKRIVNAVSDSHVMKPSFRNMRNSRPSIYGRNVVYLMLGDLVLAVTRNALRGTFKNKLEELELTDVFVTQNELFHRGTIGIYSVDACIPIVLFPSHLPSLVLVLASLQDLKIHGWNIVLYPHGGLSVPFLPPYLLFRRGSVLFRA